MEHFIKNIEITNFKSIRHAEVKDCRRVNVFIGYPNVGKSNILEALGGFSFTSLSNNISLKDIVRFKDIPDLFYNGETNQFSEISFDDKLYLGLEYKSQNSVEITIANQSLKNKGFMNYLDSATYYSSRYTNGHHETKKNHFINGATEFTHHKKERHYPAIKKYNYKEENDYMPSEDKSLIVPFGNNVNDIIETNQKLRSEIASLFAIYKQKLLFDKSKKGLRILKFLDDETVFTISIDLVADTLKRLIFYKAAILSNESTVLLLEEPEAHMFPPYISQLTTDIIFDKNQNQYFIATHSPFVLNDFMEELKDDQLSIYAVGLDNGETTITRMTDEQVSESYQYGIDLFFNLENYLKPEELVKQ